MKAFVLGGSRNIGYYAAIRLLNQGATVTFLLRYPSVFDQDATIQKFVKDGKARLVKGDALNAEDVARGWEEARKGDDNSVDLVLFTVGSRQRKIHLTKGAIIDTPDLCTKSLVNVLSTTPADLRTPSSLPRFITISSIGVTRASHEKLPFLLKPLYAFLLREPHADKLGAERVAAHVAGWDWRDEEPSTEVLGAGWQSQAGLPEQGQFKRFLVVRPAMLTSGECKADNAGDKAPYRVSEEDICNGYTVSRQDVAHFVVEDALRNWDRWEGKRVNIVY
ncbi:hypothetical protein A0H81_10877 [Grifola frondosa]|uniref:NAD(P)-binding domain-containing protein n=1 Tax=Grifola frondosa TaxID=5627 RepID=A0A1C7LYK8_GRIFR|nr:hypothetical protein A0H81_10877 [Grifola frondosa]